MKRGRTGRRTKQMVSIAKDRINILFELAEKEAALDNLPRANRYVDLARKIGMRYNVRIPGKFKRKFCKHCRAFLQPGKNSRVRIRDGRIIILCENCGGHMRIPLSSQKEIMKN